MKKHIITIILFVLIAALCASTVFLAICTLSLKKDLAKHIDAPFDPSDTIDNDSLKYSMLISPMDITYMTKYSGEPPVFKGESNGEAKVMVWQFKSRSTEQYMFVYTKETSGINVLTDVIFYDYTWRRYIVDTVLLPLHRAGTLTISDIKFWFGEDDEETAIQFSGVRGYQWSLGDDYSYLVTEGLEVEYSMLVCPDGTVTDLWPIE